MSHRFRAVLSVVAPWLLATALLNGCSGSSGDNERPLAYSIGGTVSGLRQGDGVLLKNGPESVRVSANGRFGFEGRFREGASYDVAAESPAGYACSVLNHAGVIAAMDVSNIDVQCTPFLLAGKQAVIQTAGATAIDDAVWPGTARAPTRGSATSAASQATVPEGSMSATVQSVLVCAIFQRRGGLPRSSGHSRIIPRPRLF